MSGGNCTRPDGQAPGNSGHPAANSGSVGFRLAHSSMRAARRSRRRLRPRESFPHPFGRRQARTRDLETGPKKPEAMLMEDNPLNANSETRIAGDAMECRMGEVIVGSGPLSGPPTTPPTGHWGRGGAVRSECPRAWGGSNAPTDWRSVGDPTPRNRRVPAVRATNPADRGTDAAEMKGSPQPTRKPALQVDRFTKPSHLGSAIDFERAYRMYSRRVYAKYPQMVGNEAEAEDLTQEVFLQLFRKMDSFRGESAFATWLYRVAVNIVLMSLRRKSLITSSLEEVAELREGISSLHQVLGAPDRALTTAIDRLNLERAVSQMPAGYRQVLLLHYVEGYRHREIARILGLSIGTSKSQLYKARVRLRQLLRAGESKQLRRGVSSRPRQVPQGAGRGSRRSRHSSLAGSCR